MTATLVVQFRLNHLPEEVTEWMADFSACVARGDTIEILEQIAGYVRDPSEVCGCTQDSTRESGDDVLDWCHQNQRILNTAVHQILVTGPAGLIQRLRLIARIDLMVPEVSDFPGYGKILHKSTTQGLLENFLLTRNFNPAWVSE